MIADPITQKQHDYIRSLLTERVVNPMDAAQISQQLDRGQNVRWASEIIESLLQKPLRQRSRDPFVEVPEGRYAILDLEGKAHFYKVDKGRPGTRWEGYTFVSVQGGPVDYPLRSYLEKQPVLAAIAQDPRGAMKRYGQLLGHCGVCGLPLTDETSRQLGIGPVCRGK